MDYRIFLVSLADQLDREGKYRFADIIDEDFEEFLRLLEEGKLDFDFEFSGGSRDPRGPYSNRGRELPLFGVPGPQ
ncbi:MAG: hypothetical protein ACXACY_23620 [Candidatus Hodarchaeales archaeon]|jgi:hypothetical protein